jgi:copper chaperone NosL
MNRLRLLIAIGILLLGMAYILPLWRIELEAPQYPDPIGMLIHVDSIRGIGEHDLENINILNHYIGMKPIEPESIPELRFMPWILAGFILLGIGALIVPRRWMLGAWLVVMVASSAIGLYDFNQWEIDYGTNLNPNAPIKIEGMTYKPPLIGTEKLLNITAHSYPSWGGFAILLAIAAGGVAFYCAGRHDAFVAECKGAKRSIAARATVPVSIWVLGVLLFSCSPTPRPIRFGTDECTLCKMIISDQRFGSEIVMATGKIYTFDSIECMANYLRVGISDTSSVAQLLVVNVLSPGTLIDALSARYLRSEKLPSPMGADLSAYASDDDARKAQASYGGDVLSWEEVKRYVATLD